MKIIKRPFGQWLFTSISMYITSLQAKKKRKRGNRSLIFLSDPRNIMLFRSLETISYKPQSIKHLFLMELIFRGTANLRLQLNCLGTACCAHRHAGQFKNEVQASSKSISCSFHGTSANNLLPCFEEEAEKGFLSGIYFSP